MTEPSMSTSVPSRAPRPRAFVTARRAIAIVFSEAAGTRLGRAPIAGSSFQETAVGRTGVLMKVASGPTLLARAHVSRAPAESIEGVEELRAAVRQGLREALEPLGTLVAALQATMEAAVRAGERIRSREAR